eukprot:272130-Amphidinium_carterae.1
MSHDVHKTSTGELTQGTPGRTRGCKYLHKKSKKHHAIRAAQLRQSVHRDKRSILSSLTGGCSARVLCSAFPTHWSSA